MVDCARRAEAISSAGCDWDCDGDFGESDGWDVGRTEGEGDEVGFEGGVVVGSEGVEEFETGDAGVSRGNLASTGETAVLGGCENGDGCVQVAECTCCRFDGKVEAVEEEEEVDNDTPEDAC